MIQGQMLDIGAEGNPLTLNELQSMHRLKTGALIETSLICGAQLADVNSSQLNLLESYAQNIGLAFQVTDDILNVEGDPAVMGKAAGTDKLRQKSTYPSLLGLEESKVFAGKLIDSALQALETFDQKAAPLRAIATYIIDRKK
jgi:geranylgeranyl diphosphate synthase type II